MSIAELKKAYSDLDPTEQVLFATLIAADQLSKSEEFKTVLDQRHRAMDEGRKWAHEDVQKLHEELRNREL